MTSGTGQVDQAAVSYFNSALTIYPREFKPIIGGDYSLTARFESRPEEKIFGMGQYQHGFLNQKNCVLELAQRNSQASVPFALSSLGYGFLWNNPAIGKVALARIARNGRRFPLNNSTTGSPSETARGDPRQLCGGDGHGSDDARVQDWVFGNASYATKRKRNSSRSLVSRAPRIANRYNRRRFLPLAVTGRVQIRS